MNSRFDDRTGTVMQFSDFDHLQHAEVAEGAHRKWQYYLPGSLYDVTDVDAVNHYTGMGLVRFQRSLCMSYDGFTRPCGYRSIWQSPQPAPPAPGRPDEGRHRRRGAEAGTRRRRHRASRGLDPGDQPPPGAWSTSATQPLPWPGQPPELRAERRDRDRGRDRRRPPRARRPVRDRQRRPARLRDARLAGLDRDVRRARGARGRDSAGLLTVTLPPDAAGRLELTYTPPGLTASLAAGALGLLGALALGWFGRRRKERVDEVADEEPAEAEADRGRRRAGRGAARSRPSPGDLVGSDPRRLPQRALEGGQRGVELRLRAHRVRVAARDVERRQVVEVPDDVHAAARRSATGSGRPPRAASRER